MHSVDVFLIGFITCSLFSTKDSRMICKQKEFGEVRVLVCPPENHTEMAELSYCCSNNGLMDCCNYDDYRHRHAGPDSMKSLIIVLCEICLIIILVVWCFYCRR